MSVSTAAMPSSTSVYTTRGFWEGLWRKSGAYSRFVWPIIGLVWVVVAGRVLARSPTTRAGW